MGDFSRGGDRGGRSSYGGDRGGRGGFSRDRGDRGGRGGFGGGRDRDRGPRQSFKAVCDECGKDCDLPFKPSSDKPVYCSDCFSKHREDRPKRDFGGDRRDSRGGSSVDLQKQFEVLNTKLDRILGRLGTDMPKLAEPKEDKKEAKKAEKKVEKKVEKKAAKAPAKKVAVKKAAPKKAVVKKTAAKKTTKKK